MKHITITSSEDSRMEFLANSKKKAAKCPGLGSEEGGCYGY